jgi:hypothetical protein
MVAVVLMAVAIALLVGLRGRVRHWRVSRCHMLWLGLRPGRLRLRWSGCAGFGMKLSPLLLLLRVLGLHRRMLRFPRMLHLLLRFGVLRLSGLLHVVALRLLG